MVKDSFHTNLSPDGKQESPPPDALAPEALREELINIVLPFTAGHPRREKAECAVDGILAKLAVYYAAAATPEATAEAPQTFAIIQELAHAVDRVVHAGAKLSNDGQPSDARKGWQDAAAGIRTAWNKFLATLT